LAAAMKEIGFVVLENTGIDADVFKNIHKTVEEFFTLTSLEAKMK